MNLFPATGRRKKAFDSFHLLSARPAIRFALNEQYIIGANRDDIEHAQTRRRPGASVAGSLEEPDGFVFVAIAFPFRVHSPFASSACSAVSPENDSQPAPLQLWPGAQRA